MGILYAIVYATSVDSPYGGYHSGMVHYSIVTMHHCHCAVHSIGMVTMYGVVTIPRMAAEWKRTSLTIRTIRTCHTRPPPTTQGGSKVAKRHIVAGPAGSHVEFCGVLSCFREYLTKSGLKRAENERI